MAMSDVPVTCFPCEAPRNAAGLPRRARTLPHTLIFNRTSVDVYYMEYDTERAGSLTPLRLLPTGHKRVMAGFMTTKTADLEPLDELRRRIDEASAQVNVDQLGIAPQCGFASTEEGNEITEGDQWAKLARIVETAEAIWDGVQ